MIYQPQGYSLEQIMQNLNYFQQQLMNLPPQPRNFQEQQAIQHCKAEVAKWTDMYYRATQQQQTQQYQQPVMQYQQPTMMQQPAYQPSVGQYASPIQPYQQQSIPSTTVNNGNNVTGRYSNKKTTQLPQAQVQQPIVVNTGASQATVKTESPVSLYIPNTCLVAEAPIVLIDTDRSKGTKTPDEYKEEIKNMVDKRKTVGSNSDPLYKKLDILLTDMFNVLSKNFVTKPVSADSFLNDYDDIIKYMDGLELVKDQKELDNVISYIFDTIGKIQPVIEEDKTALKVFVNSISIADNDCLKDTKKQLTGKAQVELKPDCIPDLGKGKNELGFYLMSISNEIVGNDYYLTTSSKGIILHTI